jgi:thiamine-phosphate pyrophosphorylase
VSRTRVTGLHVLADADPRWAHDAVAQARAACEGGASVVQLRAKRATDHDALRIGREIRTITRAHDVTFFVNDRFDLALRLEADGVHLGQTDLPPDRLPRAARAALAVGRSTHDAGQARSAVGERVDYVAFGPLFGTTSKESDYDARGLRALEEVVAIVAPLPVIVIGGVDAAGAATARAAGAAGAAVISAVANAADPVAATRALASAFAAESGP